MLVGISFGSALAIQVAAQEPLDGLVLLAPATWRESRWPKIVVDFLPSLLPLSIQPFKFIPINHPELKKALQQYLPGIDLDNSEQADELQQLIIPLYILDQLREVGRKGLAVAQDVHTSTLLIQGTQNILAHQKKTEYLLKKLGSPVTYQEVDGPHNLTMTHNPALIDVVEEILAFATQIRQGIHLENNK